jgi:hypothetical protein
VADILLFPKKRRRETVRGAARKALTEALASVGEADGVLIVTVSADGRYALRAAYEGDRTAYDLYSRAGQVIRVTQDRLIE